MSRLSQQEWFETPLGNYLLQRERAYFDQVVADIFGFNAAQAGLNQFDLLRANRMPFRFRVGGEGDVDLCADMTRLPLASQSIDLLLLPHVLEFSANPHQILREVERVLMPEGQVLVSGFNPISLWGLRRLWPYSRRDYPWRGNFISLPRIKDWLALLGFEVTAGRLCCYAPPFRREKWLRRSQCMEAAGDRWFPLAGGVYFVLARKRVQGMRLITPSWSDVMAAKNVLAPATQKTMEDS